VRRGNRKPDSAHTQVACPGRACEHALRTRELALSPAGISHRSEATEADGHRSEPIDLCDVVLRPKARPEVDRPRVVLAT
jgi:hypothetical protein